MTPQERKMIRREHGLKLKAIRTEYGLTQKALGALLGYTANYISRLERGDEEITQRFEKFVRSIFGQKKMKKK